MPHGLGRSAADSVRDETEWVVSPAGASAHAEYERRKVRNRERIRRQWPFALGCGVVLSVLVFTVVMAISDQPVLAVTIVGALAIVQAVGLFERSTVRAWGVGAEGERRTAACLEPLRDEGFVIFHDRKVPGWGGNLDHVAIGPTGLWAIETKSLAGTVVIRDDILRIGGHRRDKIIEQVRQEATIVQVVLGESLTRLGLRVTRVIFSIVASCRSSTRRCVESGSHPAGSWCACCAKGTPACRPSKLRRSRARQTGCSGRPCDERARSERQ